MTFALTSICATSPKEPINEARNIKLFTCEDKMALITDVVLAALVAAVATLIILSNNGVNLGQLSPIGSMGMDAAYIMFGVAGAILITVTIKLLVQMTRHINRLVDINNRLEAKKAGGSEEEVKALKEEKAALEEAQAKLQEELANLQSSAAKEKQALEAKITETKQEGQSAIKTAANTFKEQKAALEKLIQEKLVKIETLEKQIAKGAGEGVQKQIEDKNQEIKNLKAQLKLEGDIDAVNQALTQKQAELMELTEKALKPAAAKHDELQNQLKALEQKIQEAQTQYTAATEQAKQAQGQNADLIAANQEIAQKKQEVQELTAKIAELKTQNDAAKLLEDATQQAEEIKQKAEEEAKKIVDTAKNLPIAAKADSIKAINEQAHKQAEEIIKNAEAEAKKILADAQTEADKFIAQKMSEKKQEILRLETKKRELEKEVKALNEKKDDLNKPRTITRQGSKEVSKFLKEKADKQEVITYDGLLKELETNSTPLTPPTDDSIEAALQSATAVVKGKKDAVSNKQPSPSKVVYGKAPKNEEFDSIIEEYGSQSEVPLSPVKATESTSSTPPTSPTKSTIQATQSGDMTPTKADMDEITTPMETHVAVAAVEIKDQASLKEVMSFVRKEGKKESTYNMNDLHFGTLEAKNAFKNGNDKLKEWVSLTKHELQYHKDLATGIKELSQKISTLLSQAVPADQPLTALSQSELLQTYSRELNEKTQEMKGYLHTYMDKHPKGKLAINPANFFNKIK